MTYTRDELATVADLTVRLTQLRQNECKHLCIENCAPEIFYNLLMALDNAKPQVALITDFAKAHIRMPDEPK